MQLTGIGPAVGGVAETYCPRRTVLDALLAEAAAQSGAELIDGFVVADLLWSDGRAAGVRGHAARSPAESSLQAAMVVGADGLHSTVARKVGARAYRSHPPLTAAYYSYWSGISHLGASFHARPGRLILTWPTNDDLTCIYVAWPHQEFRQVRTDVEGSFHAALKLVPGLHEAVESGRREQRFTGTGDLPNLYRESAGPGWALAGDAGHHKDPCTGMGMSDAFLAADLLADAIHDGLTGRQPMDAALAGYQTAETCSPPTASNSPWPPPGSRRSRPGTRPSIRRQQNNPTWPAASSACSADPSPSQTSTPIRISRRH